MKTARPLVIGIAALAAILLAALGLLLSSSVQTWLVRRALASRPDLHLSIGRVAAGFHRVQLTDVRYEGGGMTVRAPTVDAELSLAAALLHRRFDVSQLVANGWTVAMTSTLRTKAPSIAAVTPTAESASRTPGQGLAASVAIRPGATDGAMFRGVLSRVDLPFDLSIDDLVAAGELRQEGVSTQVQIKGGGLGHAREAQFAVTARSTATDADVQALGIKADVFVRMDTPRTVSNLIVALTADATGAKLAGPVALRADLDARRSAGVERYDLKLSQTGRDLVSVQAEFTPGAAHLTGRWKADVRDADVAPFLLGRQIPNFVLTGSGVVDADTTFRAIHVAGTLDATVDRLATLNASLAEVGAIRLNADLDLAHRGEVFSVAKLNVAFATDPRAGAGAGQGEIRSVGTLRALQAFDFNPRTGEVNASKPALDLVGVALQGVPLAWVKPFVPGLVIDGSEVRGELTATPRAGGVSFRSIAPLTVSHLAISQAGRPLLHDLDVSVNLAGDYTPHAWQAELSGMTARTGSATVLLVDAKAGQLTGSGQPLKATGLITADLAALSAQPALNGLIAARRGEASVEFVASIGATKEIQARINAKNLVAAETPADGPLPSVAATIRADVSVDGRITVNAPITFERAGRSSDVTVIGSFSGSRDAIGFEAQLTSAHFVVDDAKVLGTLLPPKPESGPVSAPPWAGWSGSVALQFKQVVYGGDYRVSNVAGKVRLVGGKMELEGVRAGVGQAGEATLNATVSFDAAAGQPFGAVADVVCTDLDSGPLFAAVNPTQPPTVEGRFTITSRVTAHASTLAALPGTTLGEYEFTSRSGVFRGLPVNVGNLVENSSKIVAWLRARAVAAGDVITAPFIGRKDEDEITSRSQAANELAKLLSTIQYDQLALVVAREQLDRATVKEFSLISPDFRINGNGVIHSGPERRVPTELVSMELHLRARGRPAELMKYLGILDPKPDDLGYAACTIPVHVEGALDRLDATQLNNRLVALAVEKTGLTEKAVDWINRLRGKSTN